MLANNYYLLVYQVGKIIFIFFCVSLCDTETRIGGVGEMDFNHAGTYTHAKHYAIHQLIAIGNLSD